MCLEGNFKKLKVCILNSGQLSQKWDAEGPVQIKNGYKKFFLLYVSQL